MEKEKIMAKNYLSFFIIFILSIAFCLTPQPVASAAGLAASPAGLLIQNVEPGEAYNITEVSGVTLNITNKDNIPHTYSISAHKPSTVASRKWVRGYLEIADPSWFKLEKEEVRIEPHKTAKIKMFIEIPDDEKYYNQNWSVSLLVKGKTEAGQSVALAVAPRYEIETMAKEGLKIKADGVIAFEPHVITLKNCIPGKKKKAKAMLYNNDDKKHTYKISSMIFPQDPKKSQISLSPGYSWIPDVKWIKPKKSRLKAGAGKKAKVSFFVKIPKEQANFNQKWEAILFFEPEEGASGFIRVRIETEKNQ